MRAQRIGSEWTTLRVSIASVGWFVMAAAPLYGGTGGSESIWSANADAHLYLLAFGGVLLLIAGAASGSGPWARRVMWTTFAVLVVSGLLLSVAALLLLPVGIALVVLRARPVRAVSVAARPV